MLMFVLFQGFLSRFDRHTASKFGNHIGLKDLSKITKETDVFIKTGQVLNKNQTIIKFV